MCPTGPLKCVEHPTGFTEVVGSNPPPSNLYFMLRQTEKDLNLKTKQTVNSLPVLRRT